MNTRRVSTASLVPALALVGAAASPSTAAALPQGKRPSGRITRAEWEEGSHGVGGVSPDLCAHECGGSWGAYTHASADAFNHAPYSSVEDHCEDVDPGAAKGQTQWYCYGNGRYAGTFWPWAAYLTPYGFSTASSYYDY